MTQEEKDLVIKDLCGRLPYGVKVDHFGTVKELLGIMPSSEIVMVGYDINDYEDSVIEDIKPYLRPLSSMTEEEYNELRKISSDYGLAPFEDIHNWTPNYNLIDWLNRKMFDYQGLIPMGLALKAIEGMYKN